MTSARATYNASTPDRISFAESSDSPLRATFVPAPLLPLSHKRTFVERVSDGFRTLSSRTRHVVDKNTGMLLVAASQVRCTSFCPSDY